MKRILSCLGLPLLAAFSPALLAASLNTLDVATLPGDRVELKLGFDEPAAAPRGYTLDQPARIALDLPGVTNRLGIKTRELGVGNARSLTVVEAQGRTRLVVNLTSLVPYSTRVDGNNLFVVLGERASASASAPVAQPAVRSEVPRNGTAALDGKAISDIDFRRGEDGAGNVVITLSDPSVSPSIEEEGGKIRVSFAKTRLPEALRVRLDVGDFATPVKFVDATSQSAGASIAIEPSGRYEYLAYQTDDKLTISVKPMTEAEQRKAETVAYTGEKLSLNFQDIQVRSVLQLIADFTELNLVASDTVDGSITLRLQNVPWDQALDLVLRTKGLAKRQVGNVLLVAPAEEIAAQERQELESQRQIAELAPLRREVVQVNYAKAADIALLFQSVTASGAATEERGSIAVDERTNNIIAYQTQDRLDELRRIVMQLDIPVRQVMIEARIVEANIDYDKALGVRWGGARTDGKWSIYGKDGAQTVEDGVRYLPGTDTVGQWETIDGVAPVPFVDMGALNSTSGIGIGLITDNVILDLQLSAMEKSGNGEIVSQPKVMTADKETAKILKGAEIPYQEATSSGATSTSFKEAALSLEVTPQITPDNRIIMEVKVTKDAPDFSKMLNGVPPINKNEVNAKILVGDGETVVIGGVFSNSQTKAVDKVPFLGDLPVIGRLFRRDMVQDSKSELLVFLTPRILNHQAIAVSR